MLRKTRYSFPFSENPSGIHLKGPSWKACFEEAFFTVRENHVLALVLMLIEHSSLQTPSLPFPRVPLFP